MGIVTVCVASYGGREWIDIAQRAIASARPQAPVVHVHGDTLAAARNAALAQVETEYVAHLDADDELEPGYVETLLSGTADLRAPAVRYVRGRREAAPYVPRVAGHKHDCTAECITSGQGNWIVIGALARAAQLRGAGGWRDWPCYEDFDLWMRVLQQGATVEAIPEAVYRAYVDPQSRNRAPSMAEKNAVHGAIAAANLPLEPVGASA